MIGHRILGLPWGAYKGSRRVIPIFQRRRIFSPTGNIRRIESDEGYREEFSPFPASICKEQPVQMQRSLPHMEPPPYAIETFINRRIIVPAGGPVPVALNGHFVFAPGIANLPTLYIVPNGWTFEIKKILITMLDTQYYSMYYSILENGAEAFHIEGPDRLASTMDTLDPTFLVQANGAYMIMPNIPQDQFNTNMRFHETTNVGMRLFNDSIGEREAYVSIFGWKYPMLCQHEPWGLK